MATPKTQRVSEYSIVEERLNVLSHALGVLLAAIGTLLLLVKAVSFGSTVHIVSFGVYGASMVILYAASSLYHSATTPVARRRLKVFDHAAIYVLIAGSYTPFTLVVLEGWVGWTLFGIVWGMALAGVILKIFFTGRYDKISTAIYVLMGWLIVFAIKPLSEGLPEAGIQWLVAGGISYTVGALLYSVKRLPLNHALFHVFVVLGTVFQFITVYEYILITP
ncbi:PAQR family membrane homeostasis protein TrhA [Umboniibacter marinipuniceus]|uniref:Hemolysin III n=1 Tax=Umboniibacter marinipuniceus TaxID=569599 RepID=A0A3M0AC67_9GAMM|nr:hemolysin III family protein [Umboniibacter marinipuniceus]RMA82520.1 hemolysin III [Umboniibacter marinipuniceus]